MIRENIRQYICNNLVVFDEDISFTDTDNIFEKGFVNSLFAMSLLGYIEKQYGIKMEGDDISIANFSSVENIASLIQRKTQK